MAEVAGDGGRWRGMAGDLCGRSHGSAAEDDVEANERGTSERGARGNPCADFVAPISLARERLRRRTRAHGARELAFTRFRGSIAAFTRFPSV